MAEENLLGILTFIKNCEGLKKTLRTAWLSNGQQEDTAEHSFRLALLTSCLLPYFPEVHPQKALEMALIHDLAECLTGDISAYLKPDATVKVRDEEAAFQELIASLPIAQQTYYLELFTAYNHDATPEAHLIKALDKAETIIQHNQGSNPPDFSYAFNLSYGKKFFNDPLLQQLRAQLDAETQKKLEK